MIKQCILRNSLFVFISVIYFYVSFCDGTVLSKGKIMMCIRDKNSDPFNVVDGKACNKKLVITKSISADQVRLIFTPPKHIPF